MDNLTAPKVSCVMVTANRTHIAKRAINCFKNQTYPNKELVIVDDGNEDYSDLLGELNDNEYIYHKIETDDKVKLGQLRNLSLDVARGEIIAQWDDDDWYHPDRLKKQIELIQKGYDACILQSSLVHINDSEFGDMPFISGYPDGVPGTIVHKKNTQIRYPNIRRAEDDYYLKKWMKFKYKIMDESHSHLFIRCYHGKNTWDINHFRRKIKNTPIKIIKYLWYKYLINKFEDIPYFKLYPEAKKSFDEYQRINEKILNQ